MRLHSYTIATMAIGILMSISVTESSPISSISLEDRMSDEMVLIKGGMFEMGDVFGEGQENEKPIHAVTLSDFFISKYEVTVGQFQEFVDQTGYKTSAEAPDDSIMRDEIMSRLSSGELSRQEAIEFRNRLLALSGAGYWDADKCTWTGYNPQTNWKNPGIKQSENHPVLAVSYNDAMHFCNWLSKRAGLAVAYDIETGSLLDSVGKATSDITAVKGYRLPTEAEWEYAAREGGRKIRFGNGKDIAKSEEINFRGDEGEYAYLEAGKYIGATKPVGSYSPNRLGLYDMSGNAWEWVSDKYANYGSGPQENPYITNGKGHILRGGRWGGDAFEARVFHRSQWPRNDRCNNSGFRVARSVN